MQSHLIAIFFVIIILPSAAFAQSEIDKDPFSPGNQFDQKPLDEHFGRDYSFCTKQSS